MSRIFISHSSANNAAALAVARWLEEGGWGDYFLDVEPQRGLSPGERWQEALKAAADRCEAVLFLISPAWRDSRWCLAEFLLAKQLGKTIFGVLIEATPLGSLPPEMTTEWQLCDLVTGSERKELRVSHDPIVPETQISFATDGLGRLKHGLQKAGLGASTFQWPPRGDPDRLPYRGLKALEAGDAAVFFGREAAIVRGLDSLRGLRERGVERMLVILGASGAGKSSFLRAGLWPRLEKEDRHFLPLRVIRPERAAMTGASGLAASLEGAFQDLKKARSRADVRATLLQPGGFDGLLHELQTLAQARLESGAPAPTVVIPIDQCEELFVAEGRTEAETFLSLLKQTLAPPMTDGAAAIAARQRALAVVAIRSDSYQRLQTEPHLQQVTAFLYSLSPMAPTDYKAVIEGPAARLTAAGVKLTIEPALTEQLLADTKGADALPLLAFTLERLFVEHGGDGDLRLDEYNALGGVRGSIEAAVEAAFAEPGREPAVPADRGEREIRLRRGFIPWLALVDPETEERKRRVALWEKIPSDAQPLLERLVNQRLLVRDLRKVNDSDENAIVVEVAHEALLRQWPTLTAWLDEDADALKALDAVRRAASEWKKNQDVTYLVHTRGRLETANALARRPDFERLLGEDGQAYLAACWARDDAARSEIEAHQRRVDEEQARVADEQKRTARAQRRAKVLLALVAIVLVGAAYWIIRQARGVARQSSLVLATSAEEANNSGAFDRALRYAVLAARETPLSPAVVEAEIQLARAAHASALVAQLAGHQGQVRSAAFSPDGRRIVTSSEDTTARVWDAESGKKTAKLSGHGGRVFSAAFSPNGRRIVTASEDETARVWDAESGKEIAKLVGHEKWGFAAFSPDGRRIVTASEDNSARVWDAEIGQEIVTLTGHRNGVMSAVFSPDGRRIVTASSDATARVWDAQNGKETARLSGHGGSVVSARFSPDGRRIVTASEDNTARVWNAETGKETATLGGHDEGVISAVFSPDGRRVVTGSLDTTARVWDAESGKEAAKLVGHESRLAAAVFSPDGRRIVTASWDKTARVWDVERGKDIANLAGHKEGVLSAAFSPDGRQIIARSETTAWLWDAESGKETAKFADHEGPLLSAAFSPNGRRIVTTSGDNTAQIWDAESGKENAKLSGHDWVVVRVFTVFDGPLITVRDGRWPR